MAIAGGITGGMSLGKANEIESACPDNVCTDESDMALRDDGRKLGVASNVLISTGVTFAVVGTVFLIVRSKKSKESLAEKNTFATLGLSTNGIILEGKF